MQKVIFIICAGFLLNVSVMASSGCEGKLRELNLLGSWDCENLEVHTLVSLLSVEIEAWLTLQRTGQRVRVTQEQAAPFERVHAGKNSYTKMLRLLGNHYEGVIKTQECLSAITQEIEECQKPDDCVYHLSHAEMLEEFQREKTQYERTLKLQQKRIVILKNICQEVEENITRTFSFGVIKAYLLGQGEKASIDLNDPVVCERAQKAFELIYPNVCPTQQEKKSVRPS